VSDASRSVVEALYAAYARAVDAQDFDALAELLDPDVELVRTDGVHRGAATFAEVYREAMAATVGSRHLVTNLEVEDAGDGRLAARAYYIAISWSPDGDRMVVGAYDDEIDTSSGRARFVVKRNQVDRVVALSAAPSTQE
jgi:ketosteroid isomerase-like protein